MGVIFYAKDIHEALAEADRLKSEGKYDLFRGQEKAEWYVQSSLARYESYEDALAKLGRFEEWVKNTPGLGMLAKDVDQMLAVAQHYGLPTNFVDFTDKPKIAAIFAVDGVEPDASYEGCIICLNTRDFFDFLERYLAVSDSNRSAELIRVSVQNLWRIEAQSGVFIFLPYREIEKLYDFDRIVFPQNKTQLAFRKEEIYPAQESQLELLLRQYFMRERMLENHKIFKEELNAIFYEWPDVLPNAQALTHKPTFLASWSDINLSAWLCVPHERYDSYCQPIDVELPNEMLPSNDFASLLAKEFLKKLARQPRLRQSIVDWKLSTGISSNLEIKLRTLWNGIRVLPYSDSFVSEALANLILMAKWEEDYGISKKSFESHFGKFHEIEIASEDGSYSRAWVSDDSVMGSLRKDFVDFTNFSQIDAITPIQLYQVINDPRKVFEYDKLCEWFVKQAVPYQVLTRDEKSAIFFSPARLNVIGLP